MTDEWDDWERVADQQFDTGRLPTWEHKEKPVAVTRTRAGVIVEGNDGGEDAVAGDEEVVRQVRERFGDSVPMVGRVAAVARQADDVWRWNATDPAELDPDGGRGGGSVTARVAPSADAVLRFSRSGEPMAEQHNPGVQLEDAAIDAGLVGTFQVRNRVGRVADDVSLTVLPSPFGEVADGVDRCIRTTVVTLEPGAAPGIEAEGDALVAGDPQAEVVDPNRDLSAAVAFDPFETVAFRAWPPSLPDPDIDGVTVNRVDESVLSEETVTRQFAGILRGAIHPDGNVQGRMGRNSGPER